MTDGRTADNIRAMLDGRGFVIRIVIVAVFVVVVVVVDKLLYPRCKNNNYCNTRFKRSCSTTLTPGLKPYISRRAVGKVIPTCAKFYTRIRVVDCPGRPGDFKPDRNPNPRLS